MEFVNGIRVYNPKEGAPDFVIANGVIYKNELLDWLENQDGQEINFDIKKSKKGHLYISVNDFEANKGEWKGRDVAEKALRPQEQIKAGSYETEDTIDISDVPF